MKHWTMLVPIALLFGGVSLAQELAARPAPSTGDGILGPQLIAWSEVQKPQPVPRTRLLTNAPLDLRSQIKKPTCQGFRRWVGYNLVVIGLLTKLAFTPTRHSGPSRHLLTTTTASGRRNKVNHKRE